MPNDGLNQAGVGYCRQPYLNGLGKVSPRYFRNTQAEGSAYISGLLRTNYSPPSLLQAPSATALCRHPAVRYSLLCALL
jgi:hypothetical protein